MAPMLVRRAAAVGALAVALLTLLVGIEAGAPPQFSIADTGLGLLFIGAGAVAWERRPEVRTGPLLLASGVLWFAGSYAPTGFMPWAWLGFTFERYYDVLLALLVLTFPAVALLGTERIVLLTLAGAFLARSAARLFIGFAPGEVPSALVVDAWLFDLSQVITSAVIVLAALAVAVLAWRRLHRAAGVSRRILAPVVAAGIVAALSAAYDALELVVFLASGQPLVSLAEPWQEIVNWLPFVAVTLVPIGFLLGTLRMRLSHGVIAPLAVTIDRRSDTGQLEAALRHALGDPSLHLYVVGPADIGWRDSAGTPVARPQETADRAVTLLRGDGSPIAAIEHDPTLREDPGLVAAASAVLRLAVENERLAADVRRQLEELRASRARVIEAAEQERRRIERDLHDGAQQRLLSVALALQAAREQARREAPRADFLPRLDETADMLLAALDELREIARGIHPAVLTDEGLGLAVASLARRAAVPVELELELDGRMASPVEAAAYYVVAEALTNVTRHARATGAQVRIARVNDELVVEVRDDGDGGAQPARGSGLRGLADRVDAVGGTLEIDSPPNEGTRLRVVIPCA